MSSLGLRIVAGVFAAALLCSCASGRVRGAQGTEMGQAREYEPETKVEPPTGNVDVVTGPMIHPEPYPVLEVDLERRRDPPPSEPGPEPDPKPEPAPEPE